MNTPADPVLAFLQAAARDTVAMVPVRDALRTAELVSVILLAVVVLGLLLVFLSIALRLRGLEADLRRLIRRAEGRMDPVFERARSVAENVDYVSHVIRRDVEDLTASVEGIRRRLDRASDRMEERVQEFNALMDVVQSEAEEIFLDTAATVRGVRAGSRELGDRAPAGEEDPED